MTKTNIVVGVLLWVSAFALISSQYRVRQLTIEINRARDLAYQLDNDRVRASLAQTKLSNPTRVEQTARERLQMELPELSRSPIVEVRSVTTAADAVASNASAAVTAASKSVRP